jgi:hypothetical protein
MFLIHKSARVSLLIQRHFDIVSVVLGLVFGGIIIAQGNWDTEGLQSRGRGVNSVFVLPIFLFGFSKLRARSASLCLFILMACLQSVLVLARRRHPNASAYALSFADIDTVPGVFQTNDKVRGEHQ